MILQALCEYYDRLAAKGDTPVPGYAVTNVSTCFTLNKNGDVVNVLSLLEDKKPKPIVTPQIPKRSSGIAPGFLCDNEGYYLGIDNPKSKKKDGLAKFSAAKELHQSILHGVDDDGAKAILNFFNSGAHSSINEIASGNIVFRLEGESSYIHNRPAVKAAWEEFNLKSSSNSDIAQCLVTGNIGAIARLHGNLGGFGQDKPTLVGFNQNAFESYGKVQGANAPVSEKVAFKYVTALNALISDQTHIVRMADTKLVFWAERDAPVEDNFLYTLFGGKQDEDNSVDERSARKIKALLSSVKNGKRPDEPDIANDVTFHILGISAAKTRLVVRFFYSDTFGNLLDRIGQHYRDIEIIGTNWEGEKLTKPVSILLEAAVQHEYKNIPPTLEGALMRSIITGLPYPYSLYNALITRIRAEAGKKDNNGKRIDAVTRRVGVIKGFLNRNERFDDKKETMTVALNSEETNQGYLLGRLIAVFEKAQQEALGDVNAGVIDKYLNSALATPQTVFPVLFPLFKKHISKSDFNKGRAVNFEKLVGSIMEDFKSDGFPQTLNAENQGKFLIGYYHQRQDLFKGNSQSVDENNG